jgi:hypothetical protein
MDAAAHWRRLALGAKPKQMDPPTPTIPALRREL